MTKFRLQGKVTINVFTEIEADTLEEAKNIAADYSVIQSEWGQEHLITENWISGEYDGEVFDIEEIK